MSFPTTPLWRLTKRHLVVTERTPDGSYWTTVYPAREDAQETIGRFGVVFDGVDFDYPCGKYSRSYETVDDARKGHDKAVMEVDTDERSDKPGGGD